MKLDARQAARMLGVAETRIYRWVDAGEIPFTMVHHRPLFHRVELLEWAIEMELPIAMDIFENGERFPFADAMERGGGGVLTSGLEAIADDVTTLSREDHALIRAVIASRTGELFVTRPADWIAMPRARSPIICPGTHALVLLRWTAHRALMLKDVPINVVFLIIAPTLRRHHELLARLSLALHDRAFRTATQCVGGFAEVMVEARRWEDQLSSRKPSGATP